jgi:tetraacyldisaccharide 4'-kinase
MSLRRLLLPLNTGYRLGLWWRERQLRTGGEPVQRLRFPVISVGNLSTGGAGKTPFAIALAQALSARGFAVDVLSRGYGRHSTSATRVRLDGTAEEFGDEPLVIAHDATVPVYVARQRFEAGQLAEAFASQKASDRRPHVHILDDGFQHRQLHRDIDILLLDRGDWSDRLLPAGNLREGLRAIGRASVIGIPDSDPGFEDALRHWGWGGPVWRFHRHMEVPDVEGPVVAFCGIARPEQFFAGLEAGGLHIARRMVFQDHHAYDDDDLDKLQAAARGVGATAFVTTIKDRVRLAGLMDAHPLLMSASSAENTEESDVEFPLLTAGLRIEILDEAAALDWLVERVRDISSSSGV